MFFGQANARRTVSLSAVACAAAMIALSCTGHAPRKAPYTVRPDSVRPGDLRGPFSGRVVDGANGDPLAGALVYATWTLTSGYGTVAPGKILETVASTDKDGRYTVASIQDLPQSGSFRLTDFNLLIYKRGYVAYRSSRRFSDLGRRTDFAQVHNQVRLERWRSTMSHARHLRFIGGGPAVAPLTAWELGPAAEELSGTASAIAEIKPVRDTRSAVVAAQLLSEDQIKKVTGYDGSFETGPLGDEPDTQAYSSQHYKAQGNPQTFDVALRLWKLAPAEAATRFKELAASLPGARRVDDIGDQALRAVEGDIVASAFVDSRRGVVVMLTCGNAQCRSGQSLTKLTRIIYGAVKQLIPEQKSP